MLDALLETFGPFLLPVVLFGAGLIGYLILFALSENGVLGENK